MKVRQRNQPVHSECGVAFVEMAISLTVCILLIFSIIDVGLLIKRQIALSHIAYEGVRIASDHSRLTASTFTTQNNAADYTHAQLHSRIEKVIEAYFLSSDGFTVTTTRDDVDDSVTVSITSPQLDLFNSYLENIAIVSASVKGPYLYISDSSD